jgi:hypothetical protein
MLQEPLEFMHEALFDNLDGPYKHLTYKDYIAKSLSWLRIARGGNDV